MRTTKVINLYGGPGVGKSTIAAYLFAEMKSAGLVVELVREYVKDIVWGDTPAILDDALYLLAKQHRRQFILSGKVDYIITDAPIMLNYYYAKNVPKSFFDLTLDLTQEFDNYNIRLIREKAYVREGRYQKEEEAKMIDSDLLELPVEFDLEVPANENAVSVILSHI